MLFACQQYYRDNRRILNDIERFRKEYHPDQCIQWYTKDSFVYKLINKALRTEDIEQLYLFRFYIADLSRQLAIQSRMMKTKSEEKMKLYRGTVVNTVELEILQSKVGQLFAANGYWSASRSRSSALTFAKKCIHGSDLVTVLYEIECDLADEDDSIVFADISYWSEFSTEEEVLFDAGSIFRNDAITKKMEDDGDDLYIIEVRASREGRELARKYIEPNRIQMKEEGPRLMLCTLLRRIGNHQKSLEFLQHLLKNPADEKLVYIHNRIGKTLRDAKRYRDALRHFKEAFQLSLNSNPPENVYAAYVLHNQGVIYTKQKNYQKALKYYQDAVTILDNEIGDHSARLAQFYNSIGRIYRFQGHLDKALEYQRAALQIRELLTPNHVLNAFNYTALLMYMLIREITNKPLNFI